MPDQPRPIVGIGAGGIVRDAHLPAYPGQESDRRSKFQLRYTPPIIAVRDMIERGLLGELHDIQMQVTLWTPWELWDFLQTEESVAGILTQGQQELQSRI